MEYVPSLKKRIPASALRSLGAVRYDLWLPESRTIATLLEPDEILQGIVYGRYKQAEFTGELIGRGALIATNRRIILVDKKPLFLRSDELSYRVVSGVEYSRVWPAGTVTIQCRTGNITIRTFNNKCARTFVAAVANRIHDESSAGASSEEHGFQPIRHKHDIGATS